MVYRLKIRKRIDRCRNVTFKLLSNESVESNNKLKFTDHYMDTCIFLKNSCFNIGIEIETMLAFSGGS